MSNNKQEVKFATPKIETDVMTPLVAEKLNISTFIHNNKLLNRIEIVDLVSENDIFIILNEESKTLEIFHGNKKIDFKWIRQEKPTCPYSVYFYKDEYYMLFSLSGDLYIQSVVSGRQGLVEKGMPALLRKNQINHFWQDGNLYIVHERSIFVVALESLLDSDDDKLKGKPLAQIIYTDELIITDVERKQDSLMLLLRNKHFKKFSLKDLTANKITTFNGLDLQTHYFMFNVSPLCGEDAETYLFITTKASFILYDAKASKILFERKIPTLNMHNLSQKPQITLVPDKKTLYFNDYLQCRIIIMTLNDDLTDFASIEIEKWNKKALIDPNLMISPEGIATFIAYSKISKKFVYKEFQEYSEKSLVLLRSSVPDEQLASDDSGKKTPQPTIKQDLPAHKCSSLFLCDCQSKPVWTAEYLKNVKDFLYAELEEMVNKKHSLMVVELKDQINNMVESTNQRDQKFLQFIQEINQELQKLTTNFKYDPYVMQVILEIKEKFEALEKLMQTK